MHVVCTAGHVDHGKSTLVRALTGIEPDRFEEERRRGLTIDIGFAWMDVGADTIAFVDLPGHERFIANMLAGSGAVRLALFIVAADEGWMPQSAEHLAILDLLGVDGGVVALTRTDLVDEETRDLAIELTREELGSTVLAEAPIVPVSPVTGAGVEDVRAALAEMVAATQPAIIGSRPRLWVDRSFTVSGAGTVVTGTLIGGDLHVGQDVTMVPGGETARIRGLQQLHKTVEVAGPGRVAVNLAGVARQDLARGDAIVRGPWAESMGIDAWVRSLGDRPIRAKGAWHLHVGSAERVVEVRTLSGDIDFGGGMVNLRFNAPLPLQPGDRFVLRESGAQETVGGGQVLDPVPGERPAGRRARQRRMAQLQTLRAALDTDDRFTLTGEMVEQRLIVDAGFLAALAGVDDVDEAARMAGLVAVGTAWASRSAVARWTEAVGAFLAEFHAEQPLSVGAPRDQVGAALVETGCPPPFGDEVLRLIASRGDVVQDGPTYRLPNHRVELSNEQIAIRERLLELLDATPFSPPDLDPAARSAGATPELVRALQTGGELVALSDRVAYTAAALEQAARQLTELYHQSGAFTAAMARERLGTTRKYVVPLLEELDRRGITRRVGDRREVRT